MWDGSLVFEIREHVERHFLMRIEAAEFSVPVSVRGEPGTIELGHRGARKRTGISVRLRPYRHDLVELATRLERNRGFVSAFLGLDSKTAVIDVRRSSSTAKIRHVGFSRVVMAFPPTQKYITAGPEQTKALLATIRELGGFE